MCVQNELHFQVLHLLSFVLSSLPITATMPRIQYIFILCLKNFSSYDCFLLGSKLFGNKVLASYKNKIESNV